MGSVVSPEASHGLLEYSFPLFPVTSILDSVTQVRLWFPGRWVRYTRPLWALPEQHLFVWSAFPFWCPLADSVGRARLLLSHRERQPLWGRVTNQSVMLCSPVPCLLVQALSLALLLLKLMFINYSCHYIIWWDFKLRHTQIDQSQRQEGVAISKWKEIMNSEAKIMLLCRHTVYYLCIGPVLYVCSF